MKATKLLLAIVFTGRTADSRAMIFEGAYQRADRRRGRNNQEKA